MDTYAAMIKQQQGFKYSVNIHHDINRADTLLNYIPFASNVKVLKDIINDIIMSSARRGAHIIYGPYGAGKSYMITTLATLLTKSISDKQAQNIFISKLAVVDREFALGLSDCLDNMQPYLVVPVQGEALGYALQFEQAIYSALLKVLEKHNIQVTVKEAYLEAVQIIEKWQNNEQADASKRLEFIIENQQLSIDKLKNGLKTYNPQAMDLFKKIFREFTFAVEYQPQLSNLENNLDEINEILPNHGYKGIIFIFDEFGRYLEDNISTIRAKTIQDLAEYCDHGVYDTHLILISHREIMQYIHHNDHALLDEWKKVEGRFRALTVDLKDEFLVPYVIKKEESLWSKFIASHHKEFTDIVFDMRKTDLFPFVSEQDYKETIIYGSFPLHPIVAFMLQRLSRKIAQNQRTLFTFLSSDEANSLGWFLKGQTTDEFKMITADWLYDYFEPAIKVYKNTPEFENYLHVQAAINKLDNNDDNYSLKVKIIKSIALLNIINEFNLLKPDASILGQLIDEDKVVVQKLTQELQSQKVLVYLRQYGYFRFFEASSIDIDELIAQSISNQNGSLYYLEVLNREFIQYPIMPNTYNKMYKMTRFFYPQFIEIEQVGQFREQLEDRNLDGMFLWVLSPHPSNTDFALMSGERIIYTCHKNSASLINEIRRYAAIQYLLNKEEEYNRRDPLAGQELHEYLKESREVILKFVSDWGRPGNPDVLFVYEGKELNNMKTRDDLSTFMSDLMLQHFPDTLLVNNELVNKNNLTGIMKSCQRDLLQGIILSESSDITTQLKRLSAEYVFWRSVIYNNKLTEPAFLINQEESDSLRYRNARKVWLCIQGFFNQATKTEMKFAQLYKQLKSKPYGLRDGYMALLITVVMHNYRDSLYISRNGKDQELTAELLEDLIAYPQDYSVAIDHWPAEQENYIRALEIIFAEHIEPGIQKRNRLLALYKAMLSYYRNLSKLGRSSNDMLAPSTQEFRDLLEKETYDYRRFFFHELPELTTNYEDLIDYINNACLEMHSIVDRVIEELDTTVRTIFAINDASGIVEYLLRLFNENWQEKALYSFHFLSNRFLDLISQTAPDSTDKEFICQLAHILTGFDIEYWGDKHLDDFRIALETIYNRIQNFQVIDELAIEKPHSIPEKIAYSPRPLSQNEEILKRILIKNIDDFSQSLSYEQKRQVLIEVLSRYV